MTSNIVFVKLSFVQPFSISNSIGQTKFSHLTLSAPPKVAIELACYCCCENPLRATLVPPLADHRPEVAAGDQTHELGPATDFAKDSPDVTPAAGDSCALLSSFMIRTKARVIMLSKL